MPVLTPNAAKFTSRNRISCLRVMGSFCEKVHRLFITRLLATPAQ